MQDGSPGFDRRSLLRGAAGVLAVSILPRSGSAAPTTADRTVVDPATGRHLRVRVRLPEGRVGPVPLVLYSPGLGSGVSNGAAWCQGWAEAGIAVATISHPVTDDGLWDTSRRGLRANLAAALAGQQYTLRMADCKFLAGPGLEALGIAERIDASRIGVAGHSYGAITVQLLAEEMARSKAPLFKAMIALSPGVLNVESAQRLRGVRMPMFCITGDHDNFVTFRKGGEQQQLGVALPNRLAVYRALPPGQKQLLVLAEADHMTFAGEPIDARNFSRDVRAAPADSERAWTRVTQATTLFWQRALAEGMPGEDRATYVKRVRERLVPKDQFEAG